MAPPPSRPSFLFHRPRSSLTQSPSSGQLDTVFVSHVRPVSPGGSLQNAEPAVREDWSATMQEIAPEPQAHFGQTDATSVPDLPPDPVSEALLDSDTPTEEDWDAVVQEYAEDPHAFSRLYSHAGMAEPSGAA